jgi:hypothetical protein
MAVTVVGVLLLGAPVAAAQEMPIVAVVEGRGVVLDPQAIRAAIAERVGRAVLSPLELGGATSRGTLTVAAEAGRALIHYRDVSGRAEALPVTFANAGAALTAIVDAAAALVRRTTDSFALPSEVLDPFVGEGGTPPEVAMRVEGEEVLNPWLPVATARTHGLAPWPTTPPGSARLPPPPVQAAPATSRQAPASAPAVERADSLAAPAPGVISVD